MLAPAVARTATKAVATSADKLAPPRQMFFAQSFGGGSVEQPNGLQRGIGNPAMSPRATGLSGNETREHHAQTAGLALSAAAGAKPELGWNFGDTPLFPLDIPDQSSLLLQRKCASCEDEERLRGKTRGGADVDARPAPPIVHEVLRSPGEPMDAATRGFMESRFRRDFSAVRLHTNSRAADSAAAVNSVAYAVGRHVVFGAGQFSPGSATGRHLLAHELAHVTQQQGGPTATRGGLQIGRNDDPLEREADDVADRIVRGAEPAADRIAVASSQVGPVIRRQGANTARPASRAAPIVNDSQRAGPGQMHQSEFLAKLREALVRECDLEFSPVGRSAKDCPTIFRTIDRYATRPPASLVRVIRSFAHPPANTDADGLIRAVTARARTVARRVAARSKPRAHAMPAGGAIGIAVHEATAVRSHLGHGQPMEGSVRTRMEAAFGRPFAAVRVHDYPTAARLNEALGATAFTIGNDIAFSGGSYRPGTRSGDALIAHELAHTVQQGADGSGVKVADDEAALERQADDAAAAAVSGRTDASALLRPGDTGTRIQALPAVVAGGLILAEATPEIVVAAEIGTDVVLVDGAVTVTADVAAPAIIESAAPAALPAVTEAAAPAVIDTAVADTAASSVSTTATVVGVGAAATLSGDTPTSESPQWDCQQRLGYAPCIDLRGIEDVASSMASNSVAVTSVKCEGVSSFPAGEVFDCGGAPGENWHCTINDSAFVISLSGCMCCNLDGTVGFEWHPHQSPGSDSDRGRRRQDTRRDRREQDRRDRQRRQRRDEGGDE